MSAPSAHLGAAMFLVVIATSCALGGTVRAQNIPGGPEGNNGGLNGSLSRSDLERLGGAHGDDSTEDSKDPEKARANAKAQSEKLLKALEISCEVSDARLVVAGTRRHAAGGKPVEARVYEAACGGAMGYLLETQGTENPIGISCLSAEEARAADVAKGTDPGFSCTLPDNKDVYALVTSLIATGAGASCAVSTLQFFGRSASTRTEYTEVVCKNGEGFLLRTALPGSQAKTSVMSCSDAAKQGIKCRLSDGGPVESPVTLDTFKGALARHGVSCRIDQIRMIGQEEHLKRYVVEYRCADQPAGMIAFLPLGGNTNPYEAIDCSAAASRSLACKFTSAN